MKEHQDITNEVLLIKALIRQDFLYHRYKNALRKLGIEVYGHQLELLDSIAYLMKLNHNDSDLWRDLYINFMFTEIPGEQEEKGIRSVIDQCYKTLSEYAVNRLDKGHI